MQPGKACRLGTSALWLTSDLLLCLYCCSISLSGWLASPVDLISLGATVRVLSWERGSAVIELLPLGKSWSQHTRPTSLLPLTEDGGPRNVEKGLSTVLQWCGAVGKKEPNDGPRREIHQLSRVRDRQWKWASICTWSC